jgi:hypothetical protein
MGNENHPLKSLRHLGDEVSVFSICSVLIGFLYLCIAVYTFALVEQAIRVPPLYDYLMAILLIGTYIGSFLFSLIGGIQISDGNVNGIKIAKIGIAMTLCSAYLSTVVIIFPGLQLHTTLIKAIAQSFFFSSILALPISLPGAHLILRLNKEKEEQNKKAVLN